MTSKNKGGKYRRQRRFNPRFVGLVLSLALLISGAIGGTVAYLLTQTDDVTNTFTPAGVPITVNDSMTNDKTTKENVIVTNNGDVDAYIRVTLVATWQYKQGEQNVVYPGTPVINPEINDSRWVLNNGYYYYTEPVAPNGKTATLFKPIASIPAPEGAPDGCHLVIDVLAESIQADGGNSSGSAASIAWGVDPSTLKPN